MNKTVKRKRTKALLVAGLIVRIEINKFNQKKTESFAERILLFHQGIALSSTLNNVIHTSWRVLSEHGKIDKRRYRRYVTKHKRVRIVRMPCAYSVVA